MVTGISNADGLLLHLHDAYSSGLPECNSSVGILNARNAVNITLISKCVLGDQHWRQGGLPAIGVLGGVFLALDSVRKVEELGLVFQTQFFEDDGNFPWVGALKTVVRN